VAAVAKIDNQEHWVVFGTGRKFSNALRYVPITLHETEEITEMYYWYAEATSSIAM